MADLAGGRVQQEPMIQSQWLADVEGESAALNSLERDLSVDVAVVGGGFVGLWTAITLKELERRLGLDD